MMAPQLTLLKVFYDVENDCYGYSYNLKDETAEDVLKILIELNGLTDDVLHVLKEKQSES